MKLKLTRWLLPTFVAIILTLVLVTPALAINPPNSISVDGVWVYRNCREEGDQLYLTYYSINYTTNPTETVTEAYFNRLMNGAVELRATVPFAYYDDGYGDGVVAIYFDADDAPAWEGSYTMKMMGNPFLSWNGSVPEASLSTFNIWQDNPIIVTQTVLAGRIIELAEDLETAWGQDMVTESDTGQDVLTSYGLAYFVNVIPYLAEMAPDVYSEDASMGGAVFEPDIPDEVERTDYADSLEAAIIGTPFDLTDLANRFNVSRGAMTAILYYGCAVTMLIILGRRLHTYKPMMLLSIPVVILGSFIGVPFEATILAGLAGLGMTAYSIWYKPSTA